MTAQERIAKNKKNKNTFLDLGNCNLTELPQELFDCIWLENLSLGIYNFDEQKDRVQESKNQGKTNQINSLEGIERLNHLEFLSLINNQISDISALKELKNLTFLLLNGNQISDISALKKLKNLRFLTLNGNQIADISALKELRSLTTLWLENNEILDISPLKKLKNLTKLRLGYNQISDISPLKELKNLTNLHFYNNQISNISHLKELKNLTTLWLFENPISKIIPKNLAAPQEILAFWEKRQRSYRPTLSIFCHFQLHSIQRKFVHVYPLEYANVRFLSAQQSVASQDAYVIFLLAYDESRNEIFEFITQAENLGKKPIFLIPSSKMAFTPEEMNLEKYALIKKQHQNFRKYEHFDYDSLEDLTEKLASIAQWHKPSVCIKSLLLENIGVHEHLEINFHEKMTCLVGQNGSGKTTILRALALALVGKHPAIKKTDDLIKILGIFDDKKEGFAQENRKVIRKQGGNLALRFTVAEQPLENKVFFKQNQLDVWEMESELAYHFCSETQPADMKNLVVGFSQQRNEDEDDEPSRTNPNIWDISKLIQNQANNHLRKFEQWLIDLYAKINELFKQKTVEKQAVASLQDIAEMQIINKVFAVFSEITGQNMEFLTVWENKEVWVKISENPNGIKLKMLSQGFQSVMSWVGYFTQRMAETYFLTHKTDFYAQSAICLIDEIDTYLHPNWQANFVNALQNHFPNVQFIITTHSPLVLSALRSEQVFMVQGEIEGEILGLDATRILQEIGAEYRGGEIKISDTETVKVQEIIDELSTTVMNENWERSRELIDLLKKFNAEIPEISRFETIIKIKTRNK